MQVDSVRQFRRTRFITKREKVTSGCLIVGGVVGGVVLFMLANIGAEGWPLLLPALILGGAAGSGVWFRAYTTGAMLEEDGET